jgi:outer membrane protein
MKLNSSLTLTLIGLSLVTGSVSVKAQTLSLSQAVERALAESQAFKANESAYKATQELKSQAQAKLFPTLALSGSLTRYDNQSAASLGGFLDEARSWNLNLSQPIFNMQAYYGYQLAKSSVRADALNFQAQKQTLIYDTTSAYFSVLNAQEQEALAQQNLNALEQTYAVAKGRLDVGAGSRLDLLEAQARRDAAKATLIAAQANRESLSNQLAGLLMLDQVQVKALAAKPAKNLLAGQTIQGLLAAALNENKLLNQLRAQADTAMATKDAQFAAHYPTLNFTANWKRSETDTTTTPGPEYEDKNYGLVLNVPLFAGGETQSKAREASYRYDQTRYALEDYQTTLTSQVKQLYALAQADETRLDALEQSVKSSESLLEAAETGYKVGLKALVDLLNARAALYDAKAQLSKGVYDYYLRRLQIEQLQGDLTLQDLNLIPGA